ncbi:hypothetical protein I5535_14910 [Rhodobacteraceae bacterium F11138]|nr:hypothetical protein [Rhodobacteraceae bacterium F11138]
MRRIVIFAVLLALSGLALLWVSGGFDRIAVWAALEQRDFQNRIARSLRDLRAGETGAFLFLVTACFAYGFVHAIGPGHGKVLIGGYGLGRRVPALRLAAIGLAASLGQAVTAVVLVYTGVLLLSLGREYMIGITEQVMAPASYAAIALVGGWLTLRGLRKAMALNRESLTGHHHHDHHTHDADCGCGHRHGPTLEEISQARSWKETLALIVSIAIRPCTGALFVLLITWQMGIGLVGIAGAVAMALGTASVTIAIGIGAAGLRGGLVGSLTQSRFAARLLPAIEITAGLMIVLLSGGLLMRALA